MSENNGPCPQFPLDNELILTTKVDTDFPAVPAPPRVSLDCGFLSSLSKLLPPTPTPQTQPAATNLKFNNWNFCFLNLIKPDI